jgi:hypothetical protein
METKANLFDKLEEMKKAKRKDHDAIIQIKVPIETRDLLFKKLSDNGLSYKDLFTAAIDLYLQENQK